MNQRNTGGRLPANAGLASGAQACLLLALMALWNTAFTQEISPFRLTGIDGHVELRFAGDYYTSSSDGGVSTHRNGTTFEEELYVLLHGYVYHPNLVRLDVGGGPVFFQNRFDSSLESDSYSDSFWNFDFTMNILEKKPYPIRLFYDRRYTTTSPVARDRLLLRRTRSGIDFSIREPVIPGKLRLQLRSTESQGRGAERVVDEQVDQAILDFRTDLGPRGHGTLTYAWSEQQSASGSTALAIDPTSVVTNELDIFTKHLFGVNDQIEILNQFTYDERDVLPSREEIHYFPQLRWTVSENLLTIYRYDYFDREQAGIETTIHRGNANFTHNSFDRRLQTEGNVHGSTDETEGFGQDILGTALSFRYSQPFRWMVMGLSAGWAYDYFDRQASAETNEVIGEPHILVDSIPVNLDRLFVVEDSIRVSNVPRTQTFVLNQDYRVIVIGDTTQIQRIPTGNIEDGEEVLVDYLFETGGTATFDVFSQNYRADLTLFDYYRVYTQYRDSQPNLRSGDPTLPLNSFQAVLVGASADVPVWGDYTLGGRLEAEDYDADISPYRRTSTRIYFDMPTGWRGRLRLYAFKQEIDRLESVEDQDLTRYGARFAARPWARTSLNADLFNERDDGGTIPREFTRATLRFNWAYRRLKFSLFGSYNINDFGSTTTDRGRIDATLTRDF